MLEDVEGLNPVSLFNSLSADSVPTCECYSCPVSSGLSNGFLNTTLSPDYDPDLCQKVDPSVCKNVESFEDDSATPIIVAAGILLLLQAI